MIFGIVLACLTRGPVASAEAARFWETVMLRGESLGCLRGRAEREVALLSCAAGAAAAHDSAGCRPIPWQLDERDAAGTLVLDAGPQPGRDEPPEVIDDNDEIRFMYADAGARAGGRMHGCAVEIELAADGLPERYVYALAGPSPAARSPVRYVEYDAARDRIRGRRVSLGFGGATPRYLALHRGENADADNLLDRLKVRVRTRFLGIIPVGRDEGDLTTELVAWRAGPVRVVRRQRQWARIGWGIRSPTFGSDTYLYPDYAELPVHLRLNFPPTYFFHPIEIRAVLDFRNLHGWRLSAPALSFALPIGAIDGEQSARLNRLPGSWFALQGPEVTFVQTLATSPSLRTLERQLSYREETRAQPPEDFTGEMPAVGYRLTRWGEVGNGAHWFSSTSYALPPDYDLDRFLHERAHPVAVRARLGEE